jgi:uncharacterized protein (DUF433 family)
MQSSIEQTKEIQGGTPVLRGTRLPVKHLIDHIKEGYSFEQYARIYKITPDLARSAYREAVGHGQTRGRKPA